MEQAQLKEREGLEQGLEQEIVRLLAQTQSSEAAPRKSAEEYLRQLQLSDAFPTTLIAIAAQPQYPLQARQSTLLYLKRFVQETWSPQLDEWKGQALVQDEGQRSKIRQALLELSTQDGQERKIRSAASAVVSKIASVDFPHHWPDLLPLLMRLVEHGSNAQTHGALKTLQDLVDDCFSDDQFFRVARDLVNSLYQVAANDVRPTALRALAVSVFRSCFDLLEMVIEDHKAAVKAFADETLAVWFPLFATALTTPLPPAPEQQQDQDQDQDQQAREQSRTAAEHHRGLVALKLQAVKVLMRVRTLFPATLAPYSLQLFSATWDELNVLRPQYHRLYIDDDRQGRLEDADGLPYTLDFLVLEELDFMQACLRAPPVRKELEQQLQHANAGADSWVAEVMKLAVSYAHITTEEEGLWDIDVNIFLSEESNVTANYTPRAACGDLVIKLGEWQNSAALQGLLHHTRSLFSADTTWKEKEAALYVLNQLLGDMHDVDRHISPDTATGFLDFVRYAMQHDSIFLRARGSLVAGGLIKTSGDALLPVAADFMQTSLRAISHDPSDVVKVSCIRAMQSYLNAVPPHTSLPMQPAIIAAIADYLAQQDLSDLEDSEDIVVAIVETLRDAILLDTQVCLTGAGIDVLFTVASHGAANFQISMLITETFEEVTESLAATGPEAYAALCHKVIPSLSGAFDLGNLTEENALTNVCAFLCFFSCFSSANLPRPARRRNARHSRREWLYPPASRLHRYKHAQAQPSSARVQRRGAAQVGHIGRQVHASARP